VTRRIERAVSAAAVAAGVGLLALLAAGCTQRSAQGDADKAGGSTGRVVLRLGAAYGEDQPDAKWARYFANQVARLSKGTVRVDVVFRVGGDGVPDVEQRLAKRVRNGDYDLGWIGARAWDELGVTSFQALQAPFLITNYALLDKVVTSPAAGEMLAGLDRYGVVGLALVPDLLRHPVGFTHPLVTLSDLAGARIRTNPSRATDAIVRSLGATPVHIANARITKGIAARSFDGQEASLAQLPVSGIAVSANVVLFGKALTLFANRRAFERLDRERQAVLREAARRTVAHTATHPIVHALGFENVLLRRWCASRTRGRAVLASPSELAALVRATRPVYARLERDRQTRAFIAEIRRMSASLPPEPPITVPASCRQDRGTPRATPGRERSPSILNGTYRWVLTEKGAKAFPYPANPSDLPIVKEIVLRDGTWATPRSRTDPPDAGTYSIAGNRITLHWPSFGYSGTFTFRRDTDGTLHLKAVPQMDRGDQWVWSGAPWHRIGPPRDVTR
jgi:TRAP-type C4-dicarboxylate transport system substrate-binding protein